MLLANIGLALTASVVVAGGYVYHQGMVRVDQDDLHGKHVHVWVPAAIVPVALHVVPRNKLQEAAAHAAPFLPALRAATKGLESYPNVELVDVRNGKDHVSVRMVDGKLLISADQEDNRVRVTCPLGVLQSVSETLAENAPGI
jgi:hypothetical protein